MFGTNQGTLLFKRNIAMFGIIFSVYNRNFVSRQNFVKIKGCSTYLFITRFSTSTLFTILPRYPPRLPTTTLSRAAPSPFQTSAPALSSTSTQSTVCYQWLLWCVLESAHIPHFNILKNFREGSTD